MVRGVGHPVRVHLGEHRVLALRALRDQIVGVVLRALAEVGAIERTACGGVEQRDLERLRRVRAVDRVPAQQRLVLAHRQRYARGVVVGAAVGEVAERNRAARGTEAVDAACGVGRVVDLTDDRRRDRRPVRMGGDQHALARAGGTRKRELCVVGVPLVVGVEAVVRVRPLLGEAVEVVVLHRGVLRHRRHHRLVGELLLPVLEELLPAVDRRRHVPGRAWVGRWAVGAGDAIDVVVGHLKKLAVDVVAIDQRGCLRSGDILRRRDATDDHGGRSEHRRAAQRDEPSRPSKNTCPLHFCPPAGPPIGGDDPAPLAPANIRLSLPELQLLRDRKRGRSWPSRP